MSGFLHRDEYAYELPRMYPEKLKLFDEEYRKNHGDQHLYIRAKATHAGKITNGNLYVPWRMQASADTWLTPYPKPYLTRHFRPEEDTPNEPIGRVADARYIDDSERYALRTSDSLSGIRGLVQDAGREPLFAGIRRMLKHGLLQDANWEGLGYIELIVKVVDPEAIQKILDGRYMTVSAAATTDALTCAYCKQDLSEASCGHTRGKKVELDGINFDNFYIFGAFDYLELTETPVPGNAFSTHEITSETRFADSGEIVSSSRTLLKDSLSVVSNIFVVSKDEDFMTPLNSRDEINIYTVRDELQEVKDIMSVVDKEKGKMAKLTVTSVLKMDEAGRTQLADAFKPESVEEKTIFIRVHNSLHSMASWDGVDAMTPADVKFHEKIHSMATEFGFNDSLKWPKDELDRTLSVVPKGYAVANDEADEPDAHDGGQAGEATDDSQGGSTEDAADAPDVTPPPADTQDSAAAPDEFALFDSLEAFDKEHITDEMADHIYDLMCKEGEIAEDAKLSSEKRKSLSKGTFCGPNRSFPVNDSVHYTAAKRLLDRYKGPGDKGKILAYVERRGKALGCSGEKTKDEQTPDFKASLKDMNSPELQVMFAALLERMFEVDLFDENDCPTCEAFENRFDEAEANLEAAESELSFLRAENDALLDENASYIQQLRDEKIARILDLSLLKGETEEVRTALKDELVAEELQALDTREEALVTALDMNAIAGRLSNGLTNIPSAGTHLEDPTLDAGQTRDSASTEFTPEMATQIREHYLMIRMQQNLDSAEYWLNSMKVQGYVPRDFAIPEN